MGNQAERCLLFSSSPLLPSPGVQLQGSRLNANFPQTVRPLRTMALALEAAILTPGSRNATRLRSGATPATTTTTHAGTETTVSSRSATGTGALVFATNLATGKPRTSATWVWTQTTAGWATIVRTRALVGALLLLLAALTTALLLALDPAALKLTPRSATAPRSIATLVWTPMGVGMATTVSAR